MGGELQGQVALVTGGGRGFGRAIAVGLGLAGASVTVTARTSEQLVDTVRTIEASGGRGLAVTGDVTSSAEVTRVVSEAEGRFGGTSLLVYCAGVPWPFGPTWHVDPARWWQAHEIHVLGLPSTTSTRWSRG